MSIQRTDIAQLGKVNFIKQLLEPFQTQSIAPGGDDAAIIDRGDGTFELVATDTMLEGVDFDLQYTPLEYLGYKCVVGGVSNIYAMNGTPKYVTVSLGVSSRFSVQELEMIYAGVRRGCQSYGIELIAGNTSASVNGLAIYTTTIGVVQAELCARRSTARVTDLVCMSGNLGGALLGLHLLEREKRALAGNSDIQSQLQTQLQTQLKGYQYLLERQLKPEARQDIVQTLAQSELVPTAMTDITAGLASAALHLCQSSQVGVRIYLERLPICTQVFDAAAELGIDPVVAALNGGDDFELLFTIPLDQHAKVMGLPGIDVIGHIVDLDCGAALTTPDGAEISLQSPDFTAQEI